MCVYVNRHRGNRREGEGGKGLVVVTVTDDGRQERGTYVRPVERRTPARKADTAVVEPG